MRAGVAFLSLHLTNKNSPDEVTDEGVLSIHDFTDPGGGLIPMVNKKQSATVRMRPPQDSSFHTGETGREVPAEFLRKLSPLFAPAARTRRIGFPE
jgi:hypothetical protein